MRIERYLRIFTGVFNIKCCNCTGFKIYLAIGAVYSNGREAAIEVCLRIAVECNFIKARAEKTAF